MIIGIDATGFDNKQEEVLLAVYKSLSKCQKNRFVIYGDENTSTKIQSIFGRDSELMNLIEIVKNTQIIAADDGVLSIGRKPDSAIVKGLKNLLDKKIDCFISAGSSSALIAGSYMFLKTIQGIKRPAFMANLPTLGGTPVIYLDSGANISVTSEDLYNYALMGAFYSQTVLKIKDPRVGLLNNGTEVKKGRELEQVAFNLMKKINLFTFIGNIEGRDIFANKADVIVVDGFAGNLVLKAIEGVSEMFSQIIREEFARNLKTKLGYFASRGVFKNIKNRFNYKSYGGAFILGVNGLVIKVHGNATSQSFEVAIKQGEKAYESNLITRIKNNARS